MPSAAPSRLLPPAAALALLAAPLAAPLAAQPAPTAPPAVRTDPFCWRGRPLPRCRAFALFELGLYGGLATTRLRERPIFPTPEYPERADPAFTDQISWSVGVMRNVDSLQALGGAVLLAFGDAGNTVAGTVRWRRWAGRHASVELAAGPGASQVPLPLARRASDGNLHYSGGGIGWRPAAVAEARANLADLAAVSVRGVVVPRAGRRTHAGLFAGASLGSGLAAAGTVALGVLTALLIAALAGEYS